jgi:hypothetical protein
VGPPPGGDPLAVTSGERAVNDCFVLARVSGADVTLETTSALARGTSLLLWQVQDGFARSGDQADLTGADALKDAGRWEVTAVDAAATSGTATIVKLAGAPRGAYSTDPASRRAAQACVVPAFTDVMVAAGARIVARPWNGRTGGLVAFTASGTVTVDGEITASGLGFRGGPWSRDHFHADNDPTKRRLTDLDTTSGFGGYKGEGLDGGEWPKREGRGNVATGAGGGNNTHAGGGGGGGASKGGFGGMQHGFYGAGDPGTRGMPGVGLKLALRERLAMGGGGGQGQQVVNNIAPRDCRAKGFAMTMQDLTRGGNGGGVIVITARALKGAGGVTADGARGGCAEYDGAGGGGAGGTIWIKAEGGDFSGTVSAQGGQGGDNVNSNARVGPGGGGGGGRVRAELGAAARPRIEARGGKTGMHYRAAASGGAPTTPDPYGATAGGDGVLEMN